MIHTLFKWVAADPAYTYGALALIWLYGWNLVLLAMARRGFK